MSEMTEIIESNGIEEPKSVRSPELEAAYEEINHYQHWIRQVVEVCAEVSGGNMEARILNCDDDGDIKSLTTSINHMLDVTDAFVRESRAALEYASRGKFFRRVLLRGLPGTFRSAARVINNATENMQEQAESLKHAEVRKQELANEFERVVKEVANTVASSATEMESTSESIANLATDTSERATTVAAASEQSSANVQTVAAAVEEMSASVGEIDRQVSQSSVMSSEAVDKAGHAQEIVGSLSEASQKIGRVVSLIQKIAGQTNLLALNATIEAARAGEAGKGFSVVASEVKALAHQTSQATEDIASEIEEIQKATIQAVESIDSIVDAIKRVNEGTSTIATAVTEQRSVNAEISRNITETSTAVQEVAENIHSVTNSAQETSSSVEQMQSAARELSQQAESLNHAVDSFLLEIRN